MPTLQETPPVRKHINPRTRSPEREPTINSPETAKLKDEEQDGEARDSNTLLDRQNRSVAALLTRFKNIISLAALPAGDGFTKEVAAAEAFQMEVETNALISAAEDLLQLTRELKELWIFGPLRGIGEGEGEEKMDEDSTKVAGLIEELLKRKREEEKDQA